MNSLSFNEKFWLKVEDIVKEKNLRWANIATALDVNIVYLHHARANKNLPRLDKLPALHKILDVPYKELLEL